MNRHRKKTGKACFIISVLFFWSCGVVCADMDTAVEGLLSNSGDCRCSGGASLSEAAGRASFMNSVDADVDGDGHAETVSVFYRPGEACLKLVVCNPSENPDASDLADQCGYTVKKLQATPSFSHSACHPSLAKGDLDGDGKDEILIGFGNLYIVDDPGGNMRLLERSYSDTDDIFVAAGDLDGDGQDEFVVTHSGYYDTFDFGRDDIFSGHYPLNAYRCFHMHQLLGGRNDRKQASLQYGEWVVAAIGDLDGDRLDEIVFLGWGDVTHGKWIDDIYYAHAFHLDGMILTGVDDAAHAFQPLKLFRYIGRNENIPVALSLLDYDKDDVLDILAGCAVLTYAVADTDWPDGSRNVNLKLRKKVIIDARIPQTADNNKQRASGVPAARGMAGVCMGRGNPAYFDPMQKFVVSNVSSP